MEQLCTIPAECRAATLYISRYDDGHDDQHNDSGAKHAYRSQYVPIFVSICISNTNRFELQFRRWAADFGLSGDCRRPCTRALFGAETLEMEMEMELKILGISGEGYFLSFLDGADVGEGAKLGEALLSNGPVWVSTQDNGTGTATRRMARHEQAQGRVHSPGRALEKDYASADDYIKLGRGGYAKGVSFAV